MPKFSLLSGSIWRSEYSEFLWEFLRSQIWVRIPYNTEFLNIFYKKVSLRLGVYDPNEYFISVGAGMVAIFQNIPVEYMKKYFSFSLIRTKKYVFSLF